MATDDTARTNVYFPRPILDALRRSAEANRRTGSAEIVIAVEQYLAQQSSVTGESRQRDLDTHANQHLTGDPMPDPNNDQGTPAFGGPFGKSTADEALTKANVGRSNAADQARTHAEHFAQSGHRVGGGK